MRGPLDGGSTTAMERGDTIRATKWGKDSDRDAIKIITFLAISWKVSYSAPVGTRACDQPRTHPPISC